MEWSKIKSFFILISIMLFLSGCFNTEKGRYTNPYEYNIDELTKIDRSLEWYEKVKSIPLAMDNPTGIAVDGDTIYVTGDAMLLIVKNRGEKPEQVMLDAQPRCISPGRDGLLYIGMEDHVEVYHPDGTDKACWASLGNRAIITSIAVAASSVYVADAGNKHICRYTKEGKLLAHIGGTSPVKKDLFLIPSPFFDIVSRGDDDSFWAANTGRHTIQRYDETGKLVSSWGKRSTAIEGFCGCCNPIHMTLLPDGSFVTAEKGLPRVKVYSREGNFVCVVAGPQHFRIGATGLDLASDNDGNIFILDPEKKEVRIFSKTRERGEAQ
jgi:hypothetical protein